MNNDSKNMKKLDWLALQLDQASQGEDNFWPEGRKRLTELFVSRGEELSRTEFWREFSSCFEESIGAFGPSIHALTAMDYFSACADFSLAWDTAPTVTFPQLSAEMLLRTISVYENFIQVGGKPEWIQNADTPMCPCCERDMALLIQLDSLPREVRKKNPEMNEIHFADSGRIYVFCCKADGEFAMRHQFS